MLRLWIAAAALAVAGPGFAATVAYKFNGTCLGSLSPACNLLPGVGEGGTVSGNFRVDLDQPFDSGIPVLQSMDINFPTFDIHSSYLNDNWHNRPTRQDEGNILASAYVYDEQTIFDAHIWLEPNGAPSYFSIQSDAWPWCANICGSDAAFDEGAMFSISGTAAPIPLPPAIFPMIAAVAGLSLWRRRRV